METGIVGWTNSSQKPAVAPPGKVSPHPLPSHMYANHLLTSSSDWWFGDLAEEQQPYSFRWIWLAHASLLLCHSLGLWRSWGLQSLPLPPCHGLSLRRSPPQPQNEAHRLGRSISHLFGSGTWLWGLGYIPRAHLPSMTQTCGGEVDLEERDLHVESDLTRFEPNAIGPSPWPWDSSLSLWFPRRNPSCSAMYLLGCGEN